MPVPDFNAIGVLPPHLGNPTLPAELSPYSVTPLEVCQKLGNTTDRREILRGWLHLRDGLRSVCHPDTFQWIDGSFMEDVERRRSASPGDIDVITFYAPIPNGRLAPSVRAILQNRAQTKSVYKVDHIFVGLHWPPLAIIEHTRYWSGLFSHSKDDGAWKGILKVDLHTKSNDDSALLHLNSLGLP